MEYILSAEEMKRCDEYTSEHFHLPSSVLMERAALKTVETIVRHKFDLRHVLIVCGSGNNGGDGFAIARLLHERKVTVDVLLAGAPTQMSIATKTNYESCVSYGIPIRSSVKDEDEYSLIVDALFGIGLNRNLDKNTAEFIEGINSFKSEGTKIISVDIPSGINATTGEIMGAAIRADMTITYAYYKKGLLLYPGAEYAGKVVLANIGITDESFGGEYPVLNCLTKKDLKGAKLLRRPDDSNKGTFGKVLIIAGNDQMGGCALLAAKSCFKAGAGMVRVVTHKDNKMLIAESLPEAIIDTYEDKPDMNRLAEAIKWADVTAIGPGIGRDDRAKELFEFAFFKSVNTLLLDADAIGMLKKYKLTLKKGTTKNIVITPHIGEFAGFAEKDKKLVKRTILDSTISLAKTYHLTCVTKDARTVIAGSNGECCINTTGNNGMAVAGMGDCLFGIIAAMLARGLSPFDAAMYGCYIHGLAGDIAAKKTGKNGLMPSDLINSLKACMEAENE